MDDKNHSINSTDNMTNEPDTSRTSGTDNAQASEQGNEDVGLTSTQLNNIRRSPTDRAGGAGTKPFITGTDSDGQL